MHTYAHAYTFSDEEKGKRRAAGPARDKHATNKQTPTSVCVYIYIYIIYIYIYKPLKPLQNHRIRISREKETPAAGLGPPGGP